MNYHKCQSWKGSQEPRREERFQTHGTHATAASSVLLTASSFHASIFPDAGLQVTTANQSQLALTRKPICHYFLGGVVAGEEESPRKEIFQGHTVSQG